MNLKQNGFDIMVSHKTVLFSFTFFFFTLDWKGLQLSNIRECDVNNTPLTVCSVLVHDNDMYPNLCKFWSKSFHDINPVFMISLLFSWYHSCLLYVQCSYYEKVQLQMLLFSKTIHAVGWMENVTKIIRISLYWVTKKKNGFPWITLFKKRKKPQHSHEIFRIQYINEVFRSTQYISQFPIPGRTNEVVIKKKMRNSEMEVNMHGILKKSDSKMPSGQ